MSEVLDRYFDLIDSQNNPSIRRKLSFRLNRCFGNIDFKNKSMLDIGGGAGFYSFYAASMGAKKVVCLEPESAGSTRGMVDSFQTFKKSLNADGVIHLEVKTLQEFSQGNEKFDIIFLHNSINHLDEEACINLKTDKNSREIYSSLFKKISDLCNSGSKIIISDCSNYNIFPLLRMKNPFSPTIEWHKHQSPVLWADMLSKFDFQNPEITWNSFNRLGSIGRFFLGNKYASFFLGSHFNLFMDKK